MIFFSSDPYFDFIIYAMQVWFSYLSLPKLHISFLEVGKKRRQSHLCHGEDPKILHIMSDL
jgi:hypothetical protein